MMNGYGLGCSLFELVKLNFIVGSTLVSKGNEAILAGAYGKQLGPLGRTATTVICAAEQSFWNYFVLLFNVCYYLLLLCLVNKINGSIIHQVWYIRILYCFAITGPINTTNAVKFSKGIFKPEMFSTTAEDTAYRILEGTAMRERIVFFPRWVQPFVMVRDLLPGWVIDATMRSAITDQAIENIKNNPRTWCQVVRLSAHIQKKWTNSIDSICLYACKQKQISIDVDNKNIELNYWNELEHGLT